MRQIDIFRRNEDFAQNYVGIAAFPQISGFSQILTLFLTFLPKSRLTIHIFLTQKNGKQAKKHEKSAKKTGKTEKTGLQTIDSAVRCDQKMQLLKKLEKTRNAAPYSKLRRPPKNAGFPPKCGPPSIYRVIFWVLIFGKCLHPPSNAI